MRKEDLLCLLQRPIAFHQPLARAVGSATAGLFLSQLIYWSGKGYDPDGWIKKPWEEWQAETCLTQGEQRGARRILTNSRVIEEERRGLDPTLWFRVNFDRLIEILQGNQCGLPDVNLTSADVKRATAECENNDSCITNSHQYSSTETTTEITSKSSSAAASIFIIENEQDQLLFDVLISKHGIDVLETEARGLISSGKRPYLSNLKKSLAEKEAAANRKVAEKNYAAVLASTPAPNKSNNKETAAERAARLAHCKQKMADVRTVLIKMT